MDATMDATLSAKPLNILCIDGGGIRGISSLIILRCLFRRLKKESQIDLKPCEVFDLICGTSTGGIIALMLGRLRMSIEDTIECYLALSQRVFGGKAPSQSLWGKWSSIWGDEDGKLPKYDASELEKWVKDIIARKGDSEASLEDPSDRMSECCRTFVVAVTQSSGDAPPKIFRTYPTRTNVADECKIWEAVRATTAASPFFKPMEIGVPPETYIDGAFSRANNPAQLAAAEAHENFPDRPIGCFLSLGTGVPDVISVKGNLKKIAEACKKLVEGCERVHDTVAREFRKETPAGQTNPYLRFSVDRGLGNIALDEWKRFGDLTGITEAFMRGDEQEAKVEECVRVLKVRAEEIDAQREETSTLV